MIITAKYYSECPACGHGILKGWKMEWTPGKKPIHNECRVITPDEMIEDFCSRNKGEIVFIEKTHIKGQGDIYNFEWTMKSGKKKVVMYYQNGDRYSPGQPKTWLGVRNCLGSEG